MLPTVYNTRSELKKLASLRCDLFELRFKKMLLKILDEEFLSKIIDDFKMQASKPGWADKDKLVYVKILQAILSLVSAKRVIIAT